MIRLVCRHLFHKDCWWRQVESATRHAAEHGHYPNQEAVPTCPNCRGRGHVISCWHFMDRSLRTQYILPGQQAPNLLNPEEAEAPRPAPQVEATRPTPVAAPRAEAIRPTPVTPPRASAPPAITLLPGMYGLPPPTQVQIGGGSSSSSVSPMVGPPLFAPQPRIITLQRPPPRGRPEPTRPGSEDDATMQAPGTEQYAIGTPRESEATGVSSEFGSAWENEDDFMIIPETRADALSWIQESVGLDGSVRESHQAELDLPRPTIRAEHLDAISMARSFPVETCLGDGRPALLLDIGSVGNLAGDKWVQTQAAAAIRSGYKPEERRRERPLNVKGVGRGGEKCTHNCVLPIALKDEDGNVITGTFDTPTVPQSTLPALLGLTAARHARMIIDTISNEVYMVGPGEYNLMTAMPPGTQRIQCETAPSGHLMIPCADFSAAAPRRTGGLQLDRELALPVQAAPSETPVPDQ